MEEKKMTVGQRIAAYRKKKGYSQEDLAAMMNVTRQSVSRWESDATLPDIDRLITLSTLLGRSLEEMLGMEKDAQEGNREGLSEEQLVRVLSEYNEESREKTKKVIRIITINTYWRRYQNTDWIKIRVIWQNGKDSLI